MTQSPRLGSGRGGAALCAWVERPSQLRQEGLTPLCRGPDCRESRATWRVSLRWGLLGAVRARLFLPLVFSEVGLFVGRSGVLLSTGDPAKSLCV